MKKLLGIFFILVVVVNVIAAVCTVRALQPETIIKKVEVPVKVVELQDPYQLTKDMEVLSSYIQSRNSKIAREISDRIAWEIHDQAKNENLEIGLICGVIEVESTWNPLATSKVGAKGLMQILREDGIVIDQERVYDIGYNINTGIQILKSKLSKSKGNLNLALHWYVGEQDGYTEKVFNHMARFVSYKTRIAMEEERGSNEGARTDMS